MASRRIRCPDHDVLNVPLRGIAKRDMFAHTDVLVV